MSRICRFGPTGFERLGLLDGNDRVRDVSTQFRAASSRDWLAIDALQLLGKIDVESLPVIPAGERIGPCIDVPGKFVGIGLNYLDHAAEVGLPVPDEPAIFLKAPSSICGPADDVCLAPGSTALDWEVELGVVIGRRANCVNEAQAVNCIAGYCTVIDFSDRIFQMQRGGQWTKGKSADTYGPIGPWFVTASEIRDPQALNLWLSVDGELRQSGSTRHMIRGAANLLSYVSCFMTLEIGDLIATGTPAGVGYGKVPPRYLVEGSIVRCGVERLGNQCHLIVKKHRNSEKPVA